MSAGQDGCGSGSIGQRSSAATISAGSRANGQGAQRSVSRTNTTAHTARTTAINRRIGMTLTPKTWKTPAKR